MPFALPEYESAFTMFMVETIQDLARSRSPILSMIEVEEQYSTVASRIRDRDGMNLDLPEQMAGFAMSIDADAVRTTDVEAFAIEADRASEALEKDLLSMVFGTISTITEATGNVVTSSGGFRFDAFYEALDTMEWSLTDDGELSLPTLVMHPDAVKKVPDPTPEQLEKIESLKQRKHEELLARRRRRRLSGSPGMIVGEVTRARVRVGG